MSEKEHNANFDVDFSNTPSQMKDVVIAFDDGFSKSEACVQAEAHEPLKLKRTRPIFYNLDVGDTLAEALSEAFSLGLPFIRYGFGLDIPKVSEDERNRLVPMIGDVIEQLDEGSTEWLSVVCYLNYVEACAMCAADAPIALTSEKMMIAGATAHERRLAIRNKKNAARGKKVVEGAKQSAAQRQDENTLLKTRRFNRMSELAPKLGTNEAARRREREGLGSWEAIKKQWNRQKKNGT